MFSNRSVINSLFKDDVPDSFLFQLGQGDKREHLAAERRSEYNAYLEKKDKEIQCRRKVLEESRSVTPRSLLEFIDYEKLLAKRKEEESKFRNLNYAEPSFDKSISKSETSQKENVDTTLEKPYTDVSLPKETSVPVHRTGGGGEPVKDSSGNLITNRGFKENSSLGYFPFHEDASKHKKDFYREELRKQIEEKKRLKELEKQKAQHLEDQIAQRIEQQRKQMQMEYESELKKNILLKEKRQQERLQQLEEFQRRDAASRSKKAREIEVPHVTKESEILNIQEPTPTTKRSTSPPVPSVRSKVILERVVSPEIANKTQALSEVKPENIFSSLAEIRRTIMQDQQNIRKDLKESYEVMNRRTVKDVLEDSEELNEA
ncbi:uncharacterized protein NPIL_277012 [Nephila pilipes]|uniref:Uncharacterized protein n=1 Tax=Nephila pilipes TaxID=299642 RepID=A0A8X6PW65_NEPPI|nr:uncharacterized protein NPIL_277012 [Nephila pilipes]